ncbi:SDR family NAD(P)-dependent oxidoreductase [Arthrobacter sp. NQ7]|uniref:SDR family NAD(P)-dependent oxidoreductase n=1 Tax=Arthrobacter sp. NQ7 TaxID=3032303 RepID=UPI00240FCFD1|nr:SDR family NAD(P)-dependent oxidoreductase [Arthrobacter sp. NQ7]MDJ0460027.1 SDR family NAD(P)-dependent oxidoreductase [Arthrobacter sp. NQ7]
MTKIGLVTGGGSGIGRATAHLLASRDHHVIVADMNKENADKVVEEIHSSGLTATGKHLDVTDDAAVAGLFTEIKKEFGRLDSAVNNAGITGPIGPVHEFDLDAANAIIDVDLISVFVCLQQEIRIMQEQGSGSIVSLSSIWGLTAGANYAAYSAAKHGVSGLTRAAALETAGLGIRINAICPGFTLTPMITDQGLRLQRGTDEFKAAGSFHPMGRMGEPEEMAASICWLLGDEASFVTGHMLSVDGGFVAQ